MLSTAIETNSNFRSYFYNFSRELRQELGFERYLLPGSMREYLVHQDQAQAAMNFSNGMAGKGGPYANLQGPEGYLYTVPGQADRPEPAEPIDLRARAREILEIADYLSTFRPPFMAIPTALERAELASQERLLEQRRERTADQSGRSSIGSVDSIDAPVMISGPVVISGPLNSVSGPPFPLNRRQDTLGSGSLRDGDLDGPFDLPDYRGLHQRLQAADDQAWLRQQAALREDYDTIDDRNFAYNQSLTQADAAITLTTWEQNRADALAGAELARELAHGYEQAADAALYLGQDMRSAAFAVEDERSFIYSQDLVRSDAEWTLAGWAQEKEAAAASTEFERELAVSYEKYADAAFMETNFLLQSDLEKSFEYSRLLTELGYKDQADLTPQAAPGQPFSAALGLEPIDAGRDPATQFMTEFYPFDRPADMTFTSLLPADAQNTANQNQQTSLVAEIDRNPVNSAYFADAQADAQSNSLSLDNFNSEQSTGLNAMALAPLSIGISFTI